MKTQTILLSEMIKANDFLEIPVFVNNIMIKPKIWTDK